jgi:formylglycine-generating enzyme
MRALAAWVAFALASPHVGCSSERPLPPAPLPPPTVAPTSAPSAAPIASTPPPAPHPPPAGDGACPEDMLLVDGDYCENLERKCLKEWEAPQNNLWVCEKFAEPTRCLGKTRKMRYCIDRYEFPNKKGLRPAVMQNFYQAQLHCQQVGKRVCTETEWTKACEGPDNKPFPYGYVRDPTICRGNQPWDHPDKKKFPAREPAEIERLWQGLTSGSQPHCVSDYGVYDMPGNADELAASETYGQGKKADFDNVTTGGPWYLGVRNQCRPKIYTHDEGFAYYYLSWRCCKEADGAETDPRSPKQKKRGWSWDRVVGKAKASLMPFNPKLPGDPGYCAAGPDRTCE